MGVHPFELSPIKIKAGRKATNLSRMVGPQNLARNVFSSNISPQRNRIYALDLSVVSP